MFIPIVSPTVLACKGAIGDTLRMILTEPGSPYVLGEPSVSEVAILPFFLKMPLP